MQIVKHNISSNIEGRNEMCQMIEFLNTSFRSYLQVCRQGCDARVGLSYMDGVHLLSLLSLNYQVH